MKNQLYYIMALKIRNDSKFFFHNFYRVIRQNLALELYKYTYRVNVIHPGYKSLWDPCGITVEPLNK